MKGKHKITVQNKKIKYEFCLRRNITVIQGNSATGKTALVDMIREYYENGEESGIQLSCDKTCAVLEGRNWKNQLSLMHDSIIFIDEGNRFVTSKEFVSEIQETDNYYVIVTRESLETLPYSVDEVYGIRDSGKYGSLKQTYNELYHIYENRYQSGDICPQTLITEDTNSGFQFFEQICHRAGVKCLSANGKSNIFKKILDSGSERILVIADGAAFGSEMRRIVYILKEKENVALYLPESFEWLILISDVIKDSQVKEILNDPSDHIESSQYMSWERYFTELLTSKTEGTYLKYSKRMLNQAYLQENIRKKILRSMQGIKI